ncbi:MAG TPA: hypothetical protein VFF73_09510 [Planctomycetota bacterium]|nr:hypothetical protein [Planctomycetota bacterium]
MKLRALGLLVGMVLGGCSNLPVTIAPSNIPLTRTKYTVIGPCEGDSMGVSIIGIPVAGVRHAAEARDRAIQAGGGDALINISGDVTILDLLLVQFYWTTIQGDAVKVEGGLKPAAAPSAAQPTEKK